MPACKKDAMDVYNEQKDVGIQACARTHETVLK